MLFATDAKLEVDAIEPMLVFHAPAREKLAVNAIRENSSCMPCPSSAHLVLFTDIVTRLFFHIVSRTRSSPSSQCEE